MINLITKKFDERVKDKFKDYIDVCKFLLTHERKNICIENMARELDKLEYSAIKMDLIKLNSLINDFTDMFANAALEYKMQSIISENERCLRERKHAETKEYVDSLNEDSDARVDEFNSKS